jgi:hypothetical protein
MSDSSSSPLRPGAARLPFFYGWLLVAVAFITMALGVNARTAFSLLFPAILDEFGWDRGVAAGATPVLPNIRRIVMRPSGAS